MAKTEKKPSKDAEARQKALDDIDLEELDKVKAHQASTKGAYPVDNEWLLLAEFAKVFGWQAYLDAKNETRDEYGNLIVDTKEMLTLIEANRKLDFRHQFRNAEASFIGAISAKTKRPTSTFTELVKKIIQNTRIIE